MTNPAVVLAGLAVIAASLAGCSDGDSGQPEAPLTEEQALLREGSQKSRVCTGCHGPTGISRIPSIPSLAGKPQEYLAEQLRAFRAGERPDPTMSSIARNLNDRDIEAVSHHYASLPGAASDGPEN